jgi:phage protein D
MSIASYRIYFGDRAATQIELDRIEEIVVEQEIDMAWEARLKLALCLDDRGRWQQHADEFAEPFSRVRIEIKLGDGDFEPLIDGPVAGYDSELDSQPGSSTVTLVVRDDSVLMNREEAVEQFVSMTDDAIARQVFEAMPQIARVRVEATSTTHPVTVRRATPIQFLRKLARANGYHAYVLPGDSPGASIGCFLPDPDDPADLPVMTLLGEDRNLTDITVRQDNESPERSRAYGLRITDQEVTGAQRSSRDLTLMRQLPAIDDDQSAIRLVRPEDSVDDDAETAADAQTRRASYAYQLTGRLMVACYGAVLAPYQKVTLRAGNLRISGDYLLTKVTHRITTAAYTQEFEAKGDSRSQPESAAAGSGGLSVDLSASISVF